MLLPQPKGYFITGTDTNAGKTTITKMLLTEFIRQGFPSIGCKPIASGEHLLGNNQDAFHFLEINSLNLPLSMISPLRFNLPVSPNIAAEAAGMTICLDDLTKKLRDLYKLPINYIFFEGAGGWRVPLNNKATTVDLVKRLRVPVVLVVGIRVGCLNLALLTEEAMINDEVEVVGWIANIIDPETPAIDEHIATLQARMSSSFLGKVPYLDAQDQTCHIDIKALI